MYKFVYLFISDSENAVHIHVFFGFFFSIIMRECIILGDWVASRLVFTIIYHSFAMFFTAFCIEVLCRVGGCYFVTMTMADAGEPKVIKKKKNILAVWVEVD